MTSRSTDVFGRRSSHLSIVHSKSLIPPPRLITQGHLVVSLPHGTDRLPQPRRSGNQSSVRCPHYNPFRSFRSHEHTSVSSSAPGSSKRAILDPSSEGCWTSNSTPSSLHLIFPTPISGATQLALTFQGGFVGTRATLYVATRLPRSSDSDISLGLMMGGKLYPEDKNKRQIFRLVQGIATEYEIDTSRAGFRTHLVLQSQHPEAP